MERGRERFEEDRWTGGCKQREDEKEAGDREGWERQRWREVGTNPMREKDAEREKCDNNMKGDIESVRKELSYTERA